MTLLIRNVQILGSERKFPEKTDLFISGDKISAIGNFPNKRADEIIEGQGCFLSPGFIDVNTDSDHYLSLFDFPNQEDFLKQGVTTIVGGHCGSSLAPILYGSLESIRKWTDVSKINVNWHTLGELLAIFDKRPLGVNFATLVGHATIRRAIIGETTRANLTKNEMAVFGLTLKRALDEGGFGMSSGLSYVHAKDTPYRELKSLAEIVKDKNGVYATHLRGMGAELNSSISETIKIAKETGVRTLITHFTPIKGEEKKYEEAIANIEKLPANVNLRFDLYPFPTSVWPLYTFLPPWAQKVNGETMVKDLFDTWKNKKILSDLADIDVDNFKVSQAPGNDSLVGYSLRDLMKLYGIRERKRTLMKLMMTTKLKATIFYDNIDEGLIRRALSNPRSFVASNAASFGIRNRGKILKPERAKATFTKFLKMVLEENLMPLDQALNKITSEPADMFGIRGRGLIKEGNFADLTGFKGHDVKFVVINGRIAVKDGEYQNVLAGRTLRHA
jgi:N-acyl-D-amino-acid deacylase